MKNLTTLILTCGLVVAGCNSGADTADRTASPAVGAEAAQSSRSDSRGGTITVGEQSWTFVPSRQCSIHSNELVSISGHAAGDPSLEIVIDYTTDRGPVGVTLGDDRRDDSWFAMRDTLHIEINGSQDRGTATFNESRGGSGKSAEGSFEITC